MSNLAILQLSYNDLQGRAPRITAASLKHAFQCQSTMVILSLAARYSARRPGNTVSRIEDAELEQQQSDRWTTQ